MNKTSLLGSLLLAFLIWRVITLLIFSSAGLYSPVHPEHLRFSYARALPVLAKVFSTGDASWYLDIAANGYKQEQFSNKDQSNWAFFPVLPILIHGASYLTADNYILAGAIIANIALLAALILLFKFILSLGRDIETAWRAALFVLVFPTSYLIGLPFTESLFLFLSILAFSLAFKDRWFWASLIMSIAVTTRPTGILILPAFFWHFIQSRAYQNKYNILALSITPLGIITFAWHLNNLTGNYFAFLDIQKNWGRNNGFFNLLNFTSENLNLAGTCWNFVWLNLIAALSGLAITIWFLKKKEYVWAIYLFVPIVIALATGNLISFARIIGGLFPIYLALADILRRPALLYLFLSVSSGLLFILTLLCGLGITFAMT